MRIPKTTPLMVLGALAFAGFFVTLFRWAIQRWDLPDFVIPFVAILIVVGTLEVAGRLGPRPFDGTITGLIKEHPDRPKAFVIGVYLACVLFIVLAFYTSMKLVELLLPHV
jgi:hypothetical protein